MNHQSLLAKLLLASTVMFAFAFALVPLYDLFCQVTGLNGKTNDEAAKVSTRIDTSRQVTVELLANVRGGEPFELQSEHSAIDVHPGELHKVSFTLRNLSDEDRVMQAVPSVSPGLTAQYLHKTACFCFEATPIKARESMELVVLFYVDTQLPQKYEQMSLSYSAFDVTEKVALAQ